MIKADSKFGYFRLKTDVEWVLKSLEMRVK